MRKLLTMLMLLQLMLPMAAQATNGKVKVKSMALTLPVPTAGMTMQEVVDLLPEEYGWSDSVSNLSAKLQRESIRYKEVVELADVLDCDIVWMKRGARR